MADSFLKHWFEGFERSLQILDDENRENILKECGKSCSASFTRQIYMDEYEASQCIEDFLCRLKIRFPEVDFRVIANNEVIELIYRFCACDLVKNGYISDPFLCECSRHSLLYNWGSVFGHDKVAVRLHQSILEGYPYCKFTIHLEQAAL